MDSSFSSFLAALLLLLLARFFVISQSSIEDAKDTQLTSDAHIAQNQSGSKRIAWIDCAKGLTMLLVILGHTINDSKIPFNYMLRGLIFSFHMPLFFILSGTTSTLSADNDKLVIKAEQSFKHLILLTVGIYVINILYLITLNDISNWKNFAVNIINTFVYGSGIDVKVGTANITSLGMEWFLIVLFCSKTLYDYLHLKLQAKSLTAAVMLCALLGVAIGNIQWLPWSLDITLAVMPFFLLGSLLNNYKIDNHPALRLLLCFFLWIITFAVQYNYCSCFMGLSAREYPLFPLCYVTALAGTIVMAQISYYLSLNKHIKLLLFLGRNSIYFYCAHSLDYLTLSLWFRTDSIYINNLLRTSIDIIVCIILVQAVSFIKSKTAAALQTP